MFAICFAGFNAAPGSQGVYFMEDTVVCSYLSIISIRPQILKYVQYVPYVPCLAHSSNGVYGAPGYGGVASGVGQPGIW